MAITPMQLPSPKAYDPNQMEMTNLALFKDPYTASGASVRDSQLQLERQLNNEAYAHAVTGQQDYYNRALQAQATESMVEAIPKFLHETHGIGIMSAVPEIRRMLESMPAGMYDTYLNQSLQGEKAKALQAGGAGAKSALEAGLQTPPSEFLGATGVATNAVTPLSLQEAAIRAASGDGGGSGGIGATIQLPPIDLGGGNKGTPSITLPKKGGPGVGWQQQARDKGLLVDRPTTALPYNPNAPAGQPQTSAPPAQATKPTGSPTGAAPNREAAWDAAKKTLPPNLKPAVDAVERARAQNGGKLLIDAQGHVIGVTPEGRRIPIGRTQ